MPPNFSYTRAGSVEDAVKQLVSTNAHVLAGGTDLLGCPRDDIFPADKLVSITGLKQLQGMERTPEGGVRIGALTTVTEVAENPLIIEDYPGLAQAASEVAGPQLRNQGTIGGNLCQKPRCWYYRGEFHCRRKGGDRCYALGGQNQYHAIFGSDGICCIVHPSDTAPILVALDAAVEVVGPAGARRVPLEQFHVLPRANVQKETVLEQGEVLTEILLPKSRAGLRSSYRKVRARRSWDFAIAGLALALTFNGRRVAEARVVLSGAAPVPWRSTAVEEVITGSTLDVVTMRKAAEAAVKGAQPLRENRYKIPLFKAVLEEELTIIAEA